MNDNKALVVLILLISSGLGLMSGCSQEQKQSVIGMLSETIYDNDGELKEHHYISFPIRIDHSSSSGLIRIQGRHLSGPALDFVVLDRDQYDQFVESRSSSGFSYRYFPSLSSLNLTGQFDSGWLNLNPGEYVIVVDNSAWFDARPAINFREDTARYSIRIEGIDIEHDSV